MTSRAAAGVLVALLAWPPPGDGQDPAPPSTREQDVVHLRNGDRITGKISGETSKTIRLQTAFGRLAIPRIRIARLVRADGREETFHPWEAAPSPSPTPPAEPSLALVITGKTFWYAWHGRSAPAAPGLRLDIAVDETTVVSYVDEEADPGEIRGAVVNAFSFDPADLVVRPAGSVAVSAPEVAAGRIGLRLVLPAGLAGARRLRVAYLVPQDGEWREVASAAAPVEIAAGHETPVELRQDRGRMEYSGRRMRHEETFRLELVPGEPRPVPPA